MSKLLLFLILITLVFGETIQVGTSSSAQSSQPEPVDVVIDVPVANLNPTCEYIRQLIEFYLPELLGWELSKIMKVNDSKNGVVYYLFRYANRNATDASGNTTDANTTA
jgi:hypothetical protein